MRIVIDLQGAQASNAKRGIGRYSLSLAKAIVRNRGKHEVIIAFNGLFPESIEPLRAEFFSLLPQENIRVWNAPSPVSFIKKSNSSRRVVAEKIREAFLASLKPDIVLVSSLFEGLSDDAVTSISSLDEKIPTATILYDLIPLIYPSTYLHIQDWYTNKIEHLKNADLMLSISDSSRAEAINYLGTPEESVVNISTASDVHFKVTQTEEYQQDELQKRYSLTRPFVMYTGGIDFRKNIDGLIRAYSMLPKKLQNEHQLAIVCSINDNSRQHLEALAKKMGLESDAVIFTGFVPETDLVALYNLCKTFVFPSWHEGFGLPALEAMSCKKAVIAANTSSLPEVVGLDEALFDPRDDKSIANKLEQVLSDDNFRKTLEEHGLNQSKKFSWDRSAQKAIEAFEEWQIKISQENITKKRSRLAYISPLPPERSGISDYSAELLPHLAKFYQIDVIVNQNEITNKWIKANCKVRTVEWFEKNSNQYERVLYHFGNSHFHQHMFDLLERVPGIVVLHDFFLSGIIAYMQSTGYNSNYFIKNLFHSHGYGTLQEYFNKKNNSELIWKYPVNLQVLQNALGVIVHSENSIRLTELWYGELSVKENYDVIPLLREPAKSKSRKNARKALALPEDAFVICSFGVLGATKLNHRLIEAFLSSTLSNNPKVYLIFVGENQPGDYGNSLLKSIKSSHIKERIKITGWTDNNVFKNYLEAADVGIQLRAFSRGETSAAVLDCMNYGLATIVNANGSMADLSKNAVHMLNNDFTNGELVQALEKLYTDEEYRLVLSNMARKIVQTQHDPSACSKQYFQSIEKTYSDSSVRALPALINSISNDIKMFNTPELISISQSIANNFPPKVKMKQLFIDISELVQRDAKSGIQRVVRSLLKELISNPPHGYRVEPVYATRDSFGYFYAREFMAKFLGYEVSAFYDESIDAYSDDIFLGLDFQPQIVPAQATYLQKLYRRGISVYFVVYDLLAILKPEVFVSGAKEGHTKWLEVVTKFDGALCISKTVADELEIWMKEEGIERLRPFDISWFHLGADVENSIPSKGIPSTETTVFEVLKERSTFLMVGTIEPRKGHSQTLEAFELLWQDGVDVNLVIVGKEGWLVDELVNKLRSHSQLNKQLFWLEGISDEYLEKVYAHSTCLIAASKGEGFGLPLIEAAQHKMPIIARSIPVFREVAGESAFYFDNSNDSKIIADSVVEWLKLYKKDKYPKPEEMKWLTWQESAKNLLKNLKL